MVSPWETLANVYSNGSTPRYAPLVAQRAARQAPRQMAPQQGGGGSPRIASGSAPRPSGGNVDNWIGEALNVLKLDNSYAPGIRNMIRKESGGNPRAINNWDSNARKGIPSKGLMQTIDPTFKRWALQGYNKDVYDPVSNIIAGIRYAQNRYGSNMLRSGGRKNSSGRYIGY